jgi:hypothetical protein
MNFLRTSIALTYMLSSSVFIVACGGGGSSTPPTTPVASPTGTLTTGTSLLGKNTRTYTDGTHTTLTSLSSNLGSSFPTVTSSALTSIGLTFSDANTGVSGAQTISTVGISTPGVFSASSGNYINQIGGTNYTYSRFGYSELASSDLNNNAILYDSIAPFHVANVFSSYTPVSATYTGKLAGNFIINSSSKTRVVCDASVVYTAGTPRIMQPTISNCTDSNATAFVASGSLSSSLNGNSLSLSIAAATKLRFTNSQSVEMTAISVNSLDFLIGGPNGEELVGSGSVLGQATVAGSPVNGIFVFAFGGKKP